MEVKLPGLGIVKREATAQGETLEVYDDDGTLIDEPSVWLKTNGFLPQVLHEGAACLSGLSLKEPFSEFVIDGKATRMSQGGVDSFRLAHEQLLKQYADLQATEEMMATMGTRLEKELTTLRAEYMRLKAQEDMQNDYALLHLMDSRECPLYQVTCTCQDKNVPKVKEDVKSRLSGKQAIPDFAVKLRKLEGELVRKELYLSVLKERAIDGSNKNLTERIEGMKTQLARSNDALSSVERWEKWHKAAGKYQPVIALKDKVLAGAKALGMDLKTSAGDSFLLNGGPVAHACRVERAVLGYCLQAATGAPVILVDDFDAFDLAWKTKLLGHAKASGKTVILFASSSKPKYISGVSSWHLSEGKLQPVMGPVADGQAA